MQQYSKWELFTAGLQNKKAEPNGVVLLDTALDSENLGDVIIMDACNNICNEIFNNASNIPHISTHVYRDELESYPDKLKILCGTNILYKEMENQQQWQLAKRIENNISVCLLGVGMNDSSLNKPTTPYTKSLMKALLSPHALHSVRDSKTERNLKDMGFHNVVNTACPTMWELTKAHLSTVPKTKGKCVLTSVTDYCAELENDTYLLKTLKKEYDEVYIWLQGSKDMEFIVSKAVNINEYHIVEPCIENLNALLQRKDLDYIGTRLHAGIRALSMGRRTLIVAIDERARQISKDTGLPTIERNNLQQELQDRINSKIEYNIALPWDNINQWKKQFTNTL